MSGERFSLDSNVLVYSVDRGGHAKQERAILILDRAKDRDCVLSVQSLGEFYVAVTRKGLVASAAAASLAGNWLTVFPTCAATDSALRSALAMAASGRLAFWDAMLVSTAREAGCTLLLSEDMQDGMSVGGITVRNPFVGDELPDDLARLLGAR